MARVPMKKDRGDISKTQLQKDWHNLCSEFNLCKRKLQAKTEALLVLAKELDNVRQEKDAYKLMAEQLREKYHGQKKKYEEREKALGLSLDESDPLSERRSQSLAQILCETREQNRKAEEEINSLRQKLAESEGDIKILRENIARHRVGDEGVGTRHFPAHERESLVAQLEAAREQVENLERDMVAKIDELQEHVTERDFFRRKADHLNEELNYVLGGNEKRIVDIDALITENKYLKERLTQAQEEKSHAQATVSKYKNALEKRRGKGFLKSSSGGSLVLSQKQVENLLSDSKASSLPVTSTTIADLHSLSRALLETIHDKNVAINHQRNTNRILGKRVEELENKLKTLEVAGLWNLPPARNAALKAWQAEIQSDTRETLVPHQVSVDSDSSEQRSDTSSVISTPQHSAVHAANLKHFPLTEENEDVSRTEERSSEVRLKESVSEENLNKSMNSQIVLKDTTCGTTNCTIDSDIRGDVEDVDKVCGTTLPSEEIIQELETTDIPLQEGETPHNDRTEVNSGEDLATSTSDNSLNMVESMFDTVAEKIAKQKESQAEKPGSGNLLPTSSTPLITPTLEKENPSGTLDSPTKSPKVVVDTSPQCV
ncbi:hypothetical protein HOLleu_34192 [Holothuria leucospilota]|uniref:Coiled-coil domain-containing protein 149 n=1 Tax=Holothuria leucospilota TaxID=206669 RepID=A0A9Q0YRZ3_HOLLE|nr:hypothetical protein HOLleu_34192 [Holothuria leucospilota]